MLLHGEMQSVAISLSVCLFTRLSQIYVSKLNKSFYTSRSVFLCVLQIFGGWRHVSHKGHTQITSHNSNAVWLWMRSVHNDVRGRSLHAILGCLVLTCIERPPCWDSASFFKAINVKYLLLFDLLCCGFAVSTLCWLERFNTVYLNNKFTLI